jgi:hypothetical protein
MYRDTSRSGLNGVFTVLCLNQIERMNSAKRERVRDTPWSTTIVSAADRPELTHRELVNRIVSSPTFARSERLSTLLTYICDMTFEGRGGELNEQKVGHAVFGRSPDYDSSIDGIVRTQASRLRQRLEMYFDQEGAHESIRIIIPKGGYVPAFVSQFPGSDVQTLAPQTPAGGPDIVPPPAQASLKRRLRTRFVLPWFLCVVLGVACIVLVFRNRPQAATAMPVHPLWSQMFSSQQPTLEVPGDSGLVLSHVFDERSIPLNEYLVGDYRNPGSNTSDRQQSSEMRALRAEFANRRYTSIVDLNAAVNIANLAHAFHGSVQVRYARDVRPNDLKNGNTILVGAFEANPWVELFERNMNFILQNDYQAHVFSVINRAPRAGEPTHWDSKSKDPQRRVYGVVAFVPNLSGNGNVLLIEGTSMAGTEAAWDFASDDSELLPFLRRIQLPDGRVPHFELLLGTQNMNSSSVHSNILAWRISN